MKKFPHLRNSWRSSLITNWIRSFQVTVLVSWISFSIRLEVYLPPGFWQMSFLIFSKVGSRSSIVLKMAATPSLEIQRKTWTVGRNWAPARSGLYHIGHCRPRLTSRPALCSALQGRASCWIQPFTLYGQDLGWEIAPDQLFGSCQLSLFGQGSASLHFLEHCDEKRDPSNPRWISWPCILGSATATLAASSSRWLTKRVESKEKGESIRF